MKMKKLIEIEHIYKFDYTDSVNTEILEQPNHRGITFYESNLEVVVMPHTDPVVIIATIGNCRIGQLLEHEDSALSLLYLNCWSVMGLKEELIVKHIGKLAGFNGLTSQSHGKIMLDITLHDKTVFIDFYLMQYILFIVETFDEGFLC